MLVRVDVDVLTRNNVTASGRSDGQPIVFAHGYGCDQNMWRFVAPAFESRYRTIMFDFVGAGGSDLSAYDLRRYGSLDGYAADVIDVVRALDLHDVIFVGHSVSAMTGVLAAAREPGRFGTLVLVAPSPRYIDDDAYPAWTSAVRTVRLATAARSAATSTTCSGPAGRRGASSWAAAPTEASKRSEIRAVSWAWRRPRRSASSRPC
jgi:pimeloyl-ACP methyl ester carboxylesterase